MIYVDKLKSYKWSLYWDFIYIFFFFFLGSVFAGLGTVEALCGMTSSVMLNTIYAHTLLWMKGFVFIVVAITCIIPASLLL